MSDAQSIVVEYALPHAPDKVWRALTEPALLGAWLMPNDIAPIVGHRFTFRAKPMGDWDGVVHCRITVAEPPRKLVYTWKSGGSEESGYGALLDTIVSWTLEATSTGTRLLLEHSGFLPKDRFAFEGLGKGWRGQVAERLRSGLAGRGLA